MNTDETRIEKETGLFMNMDKMCGTQFEEGLANMKSIAEAAEPRRVAVPAYANSR